MTQQPKQNRFSINVNVADKTEADFYRTFLFNKPSLRDRFENRFGISFDRRYTNQSELYFNADEHMEGPVREAMAVLITRFRKGEHISKQTVEHAYGAVLPQTAVIPANDDAPAAAQFNNASRGAPRGKYKFQAKTEGQKNMVQMIGENDVVFGVGPAGTGKTHVAIARAWESLQKKDVERIFLARPAIGNGKDLGALPGSAEEKLAPFMRPLYDELTKVTGLDRIGLKKKIESGEIEIVPVEFMRGRTFENAFVIVDEAQNCTQEQMRMALTRIGSGSKMVVTGDPNQVDLQDKTNSGLAWAVERLTGVAGIGVQQFAASDIVRHPVVQRIIENLDKEMPSKAAKPAVSGPKAG
jgi:phosphate starvation-inducible PhoH-like protein